MIEMALDQPWLTARFPEPLRCLSWAPHRPGFVTTDTVIWREVRNADLTRDFDAVTWLADALTDRGDMQAVAMLTSRDLRHYRLEHAVSGPFQASCLATVGLSNAERVGHRLPFDRAGHGTINLLTVTDAPLSEAAQIEALSIAAQARTAAVTEARLDLPTGRATGTGTDCIVIACPPGDLHYAGLHTEVGEAIGRATYQAVRSGARHWMETEFKA